jgi:hypothetical protein
VVEALARRRADTALCGIGSRPRYGLVRLFRERRRRFIVTEEGAARANVQWAEGEKPASVRDKKDLDFERTGVSPGPQSSPKSQGVRPAAVAEQERARWYGSHEPQ